MTWFTKINSVFFRRKKIFKDSNTEIFIFSALNQLNILIYLETEFLQQYTVKNC